MKPVRKILTSCRTERPENSGINKSWENRLNELIVVTSKYN